MDDRRAEGRGQRKQSNDPGNNQHNPQYANYWAPLTRKRHIPPHSAQPQHNNDWAPRMRKRHQQEHRPQRPTERSDPTQHAKGRTGDCPGPRKETTTRRNVTQGGGGGTSQALRVCAARGARLVTYTRTHGGPGLRCAMVRSGTSKRPSCAVAAAREASPRRPPIPIPPGVQSHCFGSPLRPSFASPAELGCWRMRSSPNRPLPQAFRGRVFPQSARASTPLPGRLSRIQPPDHMRRPRAEQ